MRLSNMQTSWKLSFDLIMVTKTPTEEVGVEVVMEEVEAVDQKVGEKMVCWKLTLWFDLTDSLVSFSHSLDLEHSSQADHIRFI